MTFNMELRLVKHLLSQVKVSLDTKTFIIIFLSLVRHHNKLIKLNNHILFVLCPPSHPQDCEREEEKEA